MKLIIICFSIFFVFAEGSTWMKRFELSVDYFRSVEVDCFGNIYAFGNSLGWGNSEMILYKFDPDGVLLWGRLFSYDVTDSWEYEARDMAVSLDGSQIAIMPTRSINAKGNVALISPDGNLIKSIAWLGHRYMEMIVATASGGFAVVGGGTINYQTLKYDILVHVVDETLDNGWHRHYHETVGTNSYDDGYAIREVRDGGFLVGGTRNRLNKDFCVTKTDPDGNIIWSHKIWSNSHDILKDMCELNDGSGFVIIGHSAGWSSSEGVVVVKLDHADGSLVWMTVISGSFASYGTRCSEANVGGNFYVSGYSNDKPFVILMDTDGNVVKMMEYLTGGNALGLDVASNGDVLIAGQHSGTHMILMKLDSQLEGCSPSLFRDALPYYTVSHPIPGFSGWDDHTSSFTNSYSQPAATLFDIVPSTTVFDYPCEPRCFGVWSSYGSTCSGHGSCVSNEVCQCLSEYFGVNCEVTNCLGILSNYTDDVCSGGRGSCWPSEQCDCDKQFESSTYCRSCSEGYFEEECDYFYCFSHLRNDSKVCHSKGNCTDIDQCECYEDENFEGLECMDCVDGWYGDECDIPECFGVVGNYSINITDPRGNITCSSHGYCVGIDECECLTTVVDGGDVIDMFVGDDCSVPTCFRINADDPDNVCSAHGDCVAFDKCHCSDDFYGKDCKENIIDPVFVDNDGRLIEMAYFVSKETFINSYKTDLITEDSDDGTKVGFDCRHVVYNWEEFLTFNSSLCYFTFFKIMSYEFTRLLTIQIISEEEAFGWKNDDDDDEQRRRKSKPREPVVDYQVSNNFTLQLLTVSIPEMVNDFKIRGFESEDEDEDEDDEKEGNALEGLLWVAVAVPSLFVVLIVSTISTILVLCLLGCIGFCVLVFCIFLGGCCSCFFISQQKKALHKFEELENFDLLLNEQRVERSADVPRIQVNKQLFEISADKIELVRILGEGGSEAVVYEAIWQKKRVAFKCFKTRSICGSQTIYDEFEKEANLLASISHPNIIQFYGCCLKDPRIGYIMEYCKNGDLILYMMNKKSRNEEFLLQEKIRLFREIATGMGYLHSRKIIHRDLKLENVILDDNITCKIMDFGISRMFEQTRQQKTKGIGTSIYIAPEIVIGTNYNEKVDVFSFSILMWILLYETEFPYGQNLDFVESKVASNPFFRPSLEGNKRSKQIPEWLKNLMIISWEHDPTKRKGFSEILEYIEKYSKKNKTTKKKGTSAEDNESNETNRLLTPSAEEEGEYWEVEEERFKPIFIYVKLRSQNQSRAERFFLMNRSMESLSKIVKEKYPESKYEVKCIRLCRDQSLIRTDEDVRNRLQPNCLIDVEEYDDRDREIEKLRESLSEKDSEILNISRQLEKFRRSERRRVSRRFDDFSSLMKKNQSSRSKRAPDRPVSRRDKKAPPVPPTRKKKRKKILNWWRSKEAPPVPPMRKKE